jgi:hypothetical protein
MTFLCLETEAQSDLTSPYSSFGPGIVNPRHSVAQFSMGGSGVAIFDPYRMNLINPAASANYMEPIFETSGKGNLSTIETNVDAFENRNFEINNLSLSFPIKRNYWALNIGLVPFTSVGYDVTVIEEDESNTYRVNYFGEGGISQGYLGTGYKIYNETDTAGNVTAVSVGGQMNFNFGTVNNNRRISFFDDVTSLGFEETESVLIRDVNFELGVQAQTNLKKRTLSDPSYLKLLFGAVYGFGSDLNAEQNNYAYNFRFSSGGGIVPRDTLSASTRVKGSVTIPAYLTIGTGLDWVSKRRFRLRWAFDVQWQNWQDYDVSFENDLLQADFEQSTNLGTGVEITPNISSTRFFKTIEYRVGFRYSQTNLNLRDQEITDIGMSFGLSLPINFRRGLTRSALHAGVEYGEFGTTDNGLIKDTYIRILAGFSFTPHFRNRWFVKPKYD